MDKFGMYKKISASAPPDAQDTADVRSHAAEPDYTAADAQSYTAAPDYALKTETDAKTPDGIGRMVAAAGIKNPEPVTQALRPHSPSMLAYLELVQRHSRLSEEIDRNNKGIGNSFLSIIGTF